MTERSWKYSTPSSPPEYWYRGIQDKERNIPMRPKVAPQQPSPPTSTSSLSASSCRSRTTKRVRFEVDSDKRTSIQTLESSSSTQSRTPRPRSGRFCQSYPHFKKESPIPPPCPEVPGQRQNARQFNKEMQGTKQSSRSQRDISKHHIQRRSASRYDPDSGPGEVDEAYLLQKEDETIKDHYQNKRKSASKKECFHDLMRM